MNLNISIQTPKGLIKLTPDLTRESIIKALGYTPVDTEDIVIYESIDESDDSTFSIADNDGNVIAKFDKNGLTTTAINLKDDNSESSLITENSELSIMDDEGNIIFKVNDKGVITTDITINGYSVLNHIKNTDIHITNENKEYWDNKLDSTSEDSELSIIDNNGNIVLKVDNSGVNTGSLMIKGETVATENYVNSEISVKANQSDLTSHTGNVNIHVTSEDKEYWDNKLDSTSEDSELSITDNNGNIVLKVDNSGVNTGSLMIKGETVATENYVNSELSVKANQSDLTSHTGNTNIHVTSEDKTKWNTVTNKANQSDLTSHTGNGDIHVTSEDKEYWDNKLDSISEDSELSITDNNGNIVLKVDDSGVNAGSLMIKGETVATENYVNSEVSIKANQSDLNSHINKTASSTSLGHVKLGTNSTDAATGNHNHGTLSLTGDATGSTTISSGTSAMSLNVTIADNSHNHISSNISDSITTGTNITNSSTGLTQGKAVHEFVKSEIANLVNGAPSTLDTIDELAAALKDNANIVTVLEESISSKATKEQLENLTNNIIENEEVISASLAELDDRILNIDTQIEELSDKITNGVGGGVNSIIINGNTKTPTDGVVDLGNNYITGSVITTGTNITNSATGLTQGKAVHEFVKSEVSVKANQSDLTSHTGNSNIHVTSEDKTKWNAKQDVITDLSTIRSNASKGATANEWGNHASAGYIKQEVLNQHINDTDLHLGDEIRLDENNKLLITDKDGNITLEVNENGLNSSNIYVDGEEVAVKTQLKTINNESIVGTGNIVVNAGQNGKSVDKVTQGTITDSNGYTNTPLTFYVGDTAINNQITIKAKHGKDGNDGKSVDEVTQGTITDSNGYTNTPLTFKVNGTAINNQITIKAKHGKDGKSISSVTLKEGTGAAGTIDTYNINYSDNSTPSTFNVYNGKDGKDGDNGKDGKNGTFAASYDAENKRLIFTSTLTNFDIEDF